MEKALLTSKYSTVWVTEAPSSPVVSLVDILTFNAQLHGIGSLVEYFCDSSAIASCIRGLRFESTVSIGRKQKIGNMYKQTPTLGKTMAAMVDTPSSPNPTLIRMTGKMYTKKIPIQRHRSMRRKGANARLILSIDV